MSNQKITIEQKEEKDAASEECCASTLVNSGRNENAVARVHSGHQKVNDDLHAGPCTTHDTDI